MALSEQEKTIVLYGKEQGQSPDAILSALGKYRKEQSSLTINANGVKPTFQEATQEGVADIKQIGTDVVTALDERNAKIEANKAAQANGDQGELRTGLQNIGQVAGFASDAIGAGIKGAVKSLVPQKGEDAIKSGVTALATPVIQSAPVQGLIQKYEELKKTNPSLASDIDSALSLGDFVSMFVGGEALGVGAKTSRKIIGEAGEEVLGAGVKLAGETAEAFKKRAGQVAGDVAKIAPDMSGIVQTGKDLIARGPRAFSRVQDANTEAVVRATKMKNAIPAVQNAMKSNLDEVLIDTVTTADDATKQGYKEIVDIASDIKRTKQPSIVGGERAVQQFAVIEKQKKSVGKKLGDLTKSLSKTEKVDMQDAFGQMDDLLSNQGIVPTYTKKGVRLDFTGSKYTPAQRTKIQELYNLSTEGGSSLSPLKIREKDQLFSALKREASFEGVADIIIDTDNGPKNMFSVFRDIYSGKLDSISPELRDLNSQYRELSNITDDLEDTIFKTPNFNATKSMDQAEFAKVNLRRIFGEAQSSPAFETIADVLDQTSRTFGYKGASPKVLANFAEDMRKLFPDTIPKTGFQGGIKMGIGDIIEAVSTVGKTNLSDKQKAIVKLLQDLSNK